MLDKINFVVVMSNLYMSGFMKTVLKTESSGFVLFICFFNFFCFAFAMTATCKSYLA